ncbi:MAG: hypothetical protein WCA85_25980 [Paraburkholderia sp.]|uniref:hypothetical protein n=1 Tax=Paraburkholderia sp. TaxID=1926495 RepID=UPI003C6999B6
MTVEQTELVVAEQPQQLITIEPKKYVELVFEPFAKQFEEAKNSVRETAYDIATTAGMNSAIKHRALFRDIRIASEKARKLRKAPILEIGKLLDSRQGEIEATLLPLETLFDEEIKAEEARKEAIKAEAARVEAERQAKIQAAIDAIKAIVLTLVGKSSAEIDQAQIALDFRDITAEEFDKRAGDAMKAKADTLAKLAEMYDSAVAREEEAEQAAAQAEADRVERERVAAEQRAEGERLAALARQVEEQAAAARAAQAELDRQAQAAREEADRKANEQRAEQDRIAAEARAAEQRVLDEQAAALRAQQEAADAARRAEEAAAAETLRALEEQAEAARRTQAERERAENVAARMASEPTGGTWSVVGGAVVSDQPIPGLFGGGHDDVEYYGGHLIAESIYRPADAHLLAASKAMFEALQAAEHALGSIVRDGQPVFETTLTKVREAIDAARVPEAEAAVV